MVNCWLFCFPETKKINKQVIFCCVEMLSFSYSFHLSQ